jgi:hypothetical protein
MLRCLYSVELIAEALMNPSLGIPLPTIGFGQTHTTITMAFIYMASQQDGRIHGAPMPAISAKAGAGGLYQVYTGDGHHPLVHIGWGALQQLIVIWVAGRKLRGKIHAQAN